MHSLVHEVSSAIMWPTKKIAGLMLDVIFGREEDFEYQSTTRPKFVHSRRPAWLREVNLPAHPPNRDAGGVH